MGKHEFFCQIPRLQGLGTEKEPKTGKLGSFWLHFSTLWAPLGSMWSHYGSIWSHLRTKNKWTEGGALRPLISFSKCRSLGVFRSHLGAIWEPLRGKFGHLRTKWSQVVPNSYLHLDYSTWWWCLGSNNGLAACDSLWLLLGLYILYILKYIVYICTINMYAISIIVHIHTCRLKMHRRRVIIIRNPIALMA